MRAHAFALLVALSTFGCSRIMNGSGDSKPIPNYPGTADGLRAFATDLLTACQRDERQQVHDYFASTIMTDAELKVLFGDGAAAITPRYHGLMEAMANRGAVELVAQVYEHKYDAVDVFPIDPAAKDVRAPDSAIARALKTPLNWYAIQIRKKADSAGLRYNFFFYLNGRWRTGNKLGSYLPSPDGGAP